MVKSKTKKILAIDYGRSKLGLAIALTPLAEPLRVIRYKKEQEGLEKVAEVVDVEEIDQVVLGVSEGEMAEEIKNFGNQLEKKLQVPLAYFDETMSTKDAQKLSIRSGMKRGKRKAMEDAFAAAVLLQNYIDSLC